MQTDIIIPHFGTGRLTDLCRRCLGTIREHSRDYRLIFVDNGSPEFDQIRPEVERHEHLLIRNTGNVGFVKATNQGIWSSSAPYVVLMNNDTEAVPGWLDKLRAGFVHDHVGMVGPLTTADGSWQGTWKPKPENPYLITRHTRNHTMLAFFCVMIRRAVFDRIGVLDEGFGVGFGDDDEFCHRARAAGYDLALQQDLVIQHEHRSTFRQLYSDERIREMQDAAMGQVREKCRIS